MNVKGLTVCVEFDDLLRLTLPRNARHFGHLLVVTSPDDRGTLEAIDQVTREHGLDNVDVYLTNAFTKRGAVFNKGMCLEHGLDVVGRSGWLLVWDVDVVMPDVMDLSQAEAGKLYCPRRRMCRNVTEYTGQRDWSRWPILKEIELAGYYQLFHAEDPVLKTRPWYSIDWRHAGGYDTEFQARWPRPGRTARFRPRPTGDGKPKRPCTPSGASGASGRKNWGDPGLVVPATGDGANEPGRNARRRDHASTGRTWGTLGGLDRAVGLVVVKTLFSGVEPQAPADRGGWIPA